MSYSYREECLLAAQKRTGIVDQRERVRGKRKKVAKDWVVYWSIWGRRNSAYNFSSFSFASEEDAVRYADKIHRRYRAAREEGKELVWVVNNRR